MSSAV
jgi:hypothetical protein